MNGTITANALARHEVTLKIQHFRDDGQDHTRAAGEANIVVIAKCCVLGGTGRQDIVMEEARDSEDFIMSKTRVEGSLRNNVRSDIRGKVVILVKFRPPGVGSVDKAGRRADTGEDRLWAFSRYGEPDFLVIRNLWRAESEDYVSS